MALTVMKVKQNVFKSGIHVKTSPFGMRTLNGETRMHNGIDVVSSNAPNYTYGTSDFVVAFADGKVTAVLNTCSGSSPAEGNYVTILHDGGEITVYYHLKKGSVRVAVGDRVTAGQTIAYMGATGSVTGAHLHFGIKINGSWVDPEPYLLGTKKFSEPTPAPTPAPATKDTMVSVSVPMLKWGSNGAACKTLQTLLKAYGYKGKDGKVLTVDGDYGANTYHALCNFQKAKGLTADGYCGAKSWDKLLNG